MNRRGVSIWYTGVIEDKRPLLEVVCKITFKRFQEDGAIVLRSVVNNDWIERLRDVIEISLKEKAPTSFEHEKSAGRFFEDQFMWMRNTTARDFVYNGPMAEIAAFLTNSKQVAGLVKHIAKAMYM